jgi:hypothetical protein
MAKNRYTCRNMTVSVQSTSASWLTVGLVRSATPPPKEKGAIDVTGTTDASVVVEQGIASESTFTFQALHASTDGTDTYIQARYNDAAEKTWRVRRQYGTTYWDTTFTGIVSAIRPTAFGGNDPAMMDVDVLLTSAITDATTS